MNALLLAVILSLCMFFALFVRRLNIVHPAVLFNSMFLFNIVMLLFWIPSVPDISFNTVIIVSFSCILFLFFTSVKFKIGSGEKYGCKELPEQLAKINYSKSIAVFFIVFDLITTLLYVKAQGNVVSSLSGLTNLSLIETMGQYSAYVKFSTLDSSIPSSIKFATEIVTASGWVFGYILINNFLISNNKKLDKLLVLNIVIVMILSLLSGSRSGFVRLLIGLVTIFFLIKQSIEKKYSWYYIIKVAVVALIVIISFKEVGNILGRNNERTILDTLFMYIGGPIKNLDIFLNETQQQPSLFGEMTFANQYRNIANLTGNSRYLYQLSVLPYGVIGNIDLGNVYTALTALIYDFGVPVALFMICIMAIICAMVYRNARQVGKRHIIWLYFYSFLAYFILMSGFSEKFFGMLFSLVLYRQLFFFYILHKFFVR